MPSDISDDSVPSYYDLIGVDDIIGASTGYSMATGDDTASAAEIDSLLAGEIATGAMIATGAGRARRHAAKVDHRGNLQRNLAQRHAAMLTPRSLSKSREYCIGFAGAPVAIAGGASSQLKATPQVPFKGRRLIIPSDVAGALVILNLIVGKNPVLVSADPVAGRAFTELGVGVDLNMDTAQISQVISLSLQNTSGASVSVTPTMIGTAME